MCVDGEFSGKGDFNETVITVDLHSTIPAGNQRCLLLDDVLVFLLETFAFFIPQFSGLVVHGVYIDNCGFDFRSCQRLYKWELVLPCLALGKTNMTNKHSQLACCRL